MAVAERKEIVDVPLKKLYEAITGYDSYPKFVSGVNAVKVLERGAGTARVHFEVEMMKKVDYSLNLKDEIAADDRSARVSWTQDASKFFKTNNGLWELKSMGPSKTEVLYRLEIDFNFPVPGFMLKTLVASALPKAIHDFTERAKKA
jgi:ribosome-associated toxin RatA of RatAB toxin-antitoxin module